MPLRLAAGAVNLPVSPSRSTARSARHALAVVEREYMEYHEDLVWTPDGSRTWPSPGQGETQCSE